VTFFSSRTERDVRRPKLWVDFVLFLTAVIKRQNKEDHAGQGLTVGKHVRTLIDKFSFDCKTNLRNRTEMMSTVAL